MIVAKGIFNIQATTTTDLDGNNVINFFYEVKYNYDTDTTAFDSYYQYSYWIPVQAISLALVVNLANGVETFEINYNKNQILFTEGDFYNIDAAQVLNVGSIFSLISPIIYS